MVEYKYIKVPRDPYSEVIFDDEFFAQYDKFSDFLEDKDWEKQPKKTMMVAIISTNNE